MVSLQHSGSWWDFRRRGKWILSYLWALLKRVLRRSENSGEIARRRLQFVLVQDRSSLTLANIESMKNDLLDVLSKYLVIDHDSIELEVKRSGGTLTLLSSIRVGDATSQAAQPAIAAEAEAA